jgi:hemoglobin-like flavoprotein
MEFSTGKCRQQHCQTEALIQDLDCIEQPLQASPHVETLVKKHPGADIQPDSTTE